MRHGPLFEIRVPGHLAQRVAITSPKNARRREPARRGAWPDGAPCRANAPWRTPHRIQRRPSAPLHGPATPAGSGEPAHSWGYSRRARACRGDGASCRPVRAKSRLPPEVVRRQTDNTARAGGRRKTRCRPIRPAFARGPDRLRGASCPTNRQTARNARPRAPGSRALLSNSHAAAARIPARANIAADLRTPRGSRRRPAATPSATSWRALRDGYGPGRSAIPLACGVGRAPA